MALPNEYCITIVIPYAHDCEYGPLPAGKYRATVIEHHDSFRDPLPVIREAQFEVRPDTPVIGFSWGRIRALYR
jgi:hypothetical protein